MGGVAYTEKKAAGTAILAARKTLTDDNAVIPLGEYRGFQMELSFDPFYKDYTSGSSRAGASASSPTSPSTISFSCLSIFSRMFSSSRRADFVFSSSSWGNGFETFVDAQGTAFQEYVSSITAKLPKTDKEYRAIRDKMEGIFQQYPHKSLDVAENVRTQAYAAVTDT